MLCCIIIIAIVAIVGLLLSPIIIPARTIRTLYDRFKSKSKVNSKSVDHQTFKEE